MLNHKFCYALMQAVSLSELSDALLKRAKRRAKMEGRTRDEPISGGAPYALSDRSVGDPKAQDPLARRTWAEICDGIYGGR